MNEEYICPMCESEEYKKIMSKKVGEIMVNAVMCKECGIIYGVVVE